ncbi:hypothetical protein BGW80DRAFT_1342557 [Lactifluus volemus]|nr:hypothetical protein BGW80DRAFT_1417103 [Lactifluus volemus]KAH9966226.1 hypothetical protein BGW80DRAFT_1342557 [Lactifluus volemus]
MRTSEVRKPPTRALWLILFLDVTVNLNTLQVQCDVAMARVVLQISHVSLPPLGSPTDYCYHTAAFRLGSQPNFLLPCLSGLTNLRVSPSCHSSLNVTFLSHFGLYALRPVCLRECMNSRVVFRFTGT